MRKPTKKPSPNQPNKANQVRIIGGQFKRRTLGFVDADGLRPTPDRLRETIFNWLMADIHDARVLDMCAGSGVLGFEALSRGAKHATLIEPNPAQVAELKRSADTLRLTKDHIQLINAPAQTALPTLTTPFDIIFIDPPYALDLWRELLSLTKKHNLYHKDTLIYLESDTPLDTLIATFDDVPLTTIKATKVGQVYAGLFCLA